MTLLDELLLSALYDAFADFTEINCALSSCPFLLFVLFLLVKYPCVMQSKTMFHLVGLKTIAGNSDTVHLVSRQMVGCYIVATMYSIYYILPQFSSARRWILVCFLTSTLSNYSRLFLSTYLLPSSLFNASKLLLSSIRTSRFLWILLILNQVSFLDSMVDRY